MKLIGQLCLFISIMFLIMACFASSEASLIIDCPNSFIPALVKAIS